MSTEVSLVRDLMAFGFSEKEAKIYLSLLELGNATANQIAEKSKVNRSTTYIILSSLKTKGMVGTIEKSSVQEFFPISPEILTQVAESSLLTAEEKLDRIKRILPELKGLYTEISYRPKVRIFEGVDGLGTALVEAATDNKEKCLRAFSSGETILSIAPGYLMQWNEARQKNNISIKTIFVENVSSRTIMSMTAGNGKNVFVSKENYPFPVDAMIWDDKVGYLIVEDDQITTIVLEAKEIGLVMKNMFDMAFEQAKLNGTYEET